MFACIYSRTVAKSPEIIKRLLTELAFSFSPLVEQTSDDTVVLDISGQGLLFGDPENPVQTTAAYCPSRNIANEIVQRATRSNLKINVALAANPDTAIHAARSFKGITVIAVNEKDLQLEALSIKRLDYSLARIEAGRAEEIQETFALWGLRTFGDLARLPLSGIAERLGQDGVRLQKLAQGKTDRRLNLVRPSIGFAQSLELEHPVSELEPLSFILSRLLNQLCANLHEYALATNELKIELKLEDRTQHQCAITLPVPMRNPKTLLRLLLFDIESRPPQAPVVVVTITAEPVKPRGSQTGLFIPLAPEPEKLEITLARLAKLVGLDNVGSPEICDTHRPDAFRMNKFRLAEKSPTNLKKSLQSTDAGRTSTPAGLPGRGPRLPALPVMGFRIFRPAWRAYVQTKHGKPTRLSASSEQSAGKVRGAVICAAGPWRASGDWWRQDVWARDEWDVAVIDPASPESEILCRVYRDLASEQWFVAGIYD
jgi:protein ImuB